MLTFIGLYFYIFDDSSEYFNDKMNYVYYSGKELSLDESMIL